MKHSTPFPGDAFHRHQRMRHLTILTALAGILLVVFLISVHSGYTRLSILDTLRLLLGGGSTKEKMILWDFRMPRILIAMLAGAGFAISGCIVQGVTRNPLADPGLLGINAGASIFVVLYVVASGAQSLYSVFTLPFLALAGAALAAILIYLLASRRGEGPAPLRMVLVGIAVQAGLSALMTVLVIRMDDRQFDFVARWSAGTVWGTSTQYVFALAPWLAVFVPFAFAHSRSLDLLCLGDDMATGLGVRLARQRKQLLAVAVAIAAACVAVSGSIGFVGLIAPHISRRLAGERHRVLLPACALIGASLVLGADTIGRTAIQPAEIPAGIVTAAIGAPYFLYLLAKSR